MRSSLPASAPPAFHATGHPTIHPVALAKWPVYAVVLATVAFLLVALLAPDANARRRKRKRKAGPVRIAVLPFEGMGVAGGVMRESLEIELEMLEKIRLQSSATAARSVVRDGKRAFTSRKLRRTLKKAKLDALVKGQQMEGEQVLVVVYAADGRPRFAEFFKRGDDIDTLAATIVTSLKSTLLRFSSAKVVSIPREPPPSSAQAARDRNPIDEDDLFVDLEGGEKEEPKKERRKKRTRTAAKTRDKPRARDDDSSDRRLIVGADAPDDIDDERPRRRRAVDDRAVSGASSRSRKSFSKLTDEEPEEVDDRETGGFFQPGPLTPMLSVMGGVQGGTWIYDFAGKDTNQSYGFNRPFPGGAARVAFWPMQYFGVEVDGGFDYLYFEFDQPENGEGITPGQFSIPHVTAGVAARARYILELSSSFGIGIGARIGYRFDFVGVEPQTMGTGNNIATVTIVPGYMLNALVIGPEIFVPFKIGSNRMEVQLSTEINPGISRYEEMPDNPGDNSLAFGGTAHLTAKAEIFAGIFAFVGGYGSIIVTNYELAGDRLSPIAGLDGTREKFQGGTVTSINVGGRAGLGWEF